MSVDLDIRADIEAATKNLYAYERRVLPRAINRSLNQTASNVKVAAKRAISKRAGIAQKRIEPYVKIRKSTFLTLSADVVTNRRSFNAIEFVTAAKRKPGAFRKQKGVTAKTWGTSTLHEGAFIVWGQYSGKAVVIARRGKNRYKTKTIYGPALHVEFNRPAMRRYLKIVARKRFGVNFNRNLNFYVSRAG